MKPIAYGVATMLIAILLTAPGFAHCDTMDGPVITAAKTSLDTGNINHVLVWVQPGDEKDVREAFEIALADRTHENEIAFYETLVKVHREGEGAEYTGIKPAGQVEPIVKLSDKAIEEGNPEILVEPLTHAMQNGIREKYHELEERKDHDANDVEAGRDYIAHYVGFMHYVESIDMSVHASGEHHAARTEVHENEAEMHEAELEPEKTGSQSIAGWTAAGVVSLSALALFVAKKKK